MKGKIATPLKLAALILLAGVMASCGGGSSGPSTGTLQAGLTDAASSTFSSVVIAIQAVRAAPAGRENDADAGLPLIASFDPPLQVDVLNLSFVQQSLGEAVLPAGPYHQFRLILAENTDPNNPANYIVLTGSTDKIPLETPSGQTSGLKVNAPGTFEVKAGQINTILLDFDPDRAIVQAGSSGNWNFKPTGIRIVQVANGLTEFGTLSGTVAPSQAWSDALVSAVDPTSQVTVASGLVNPDDGTFKMFLPAGTYELRVTASGYASFSSLPTTYDVVVGQETDAGTLTLTPNP